MADVSFCPRCEYPAIIQERDEQPVGEAGVSGKSSGSQSVLNLIVMRRCILSYVSPNCFEYVAQFLRGRSPR